MLPFLHINLGFFHVFHLGPFHIPFGVWDLPTFGLMLWVATLAAALVMHLNFRRSGIEADALGMVAMSVVAGVVGAKLWHVVDTPSEFAADGWQVLLSTGGFAWFGGLVGGILALVVQGKQARIGGLRTLDLAAPAAAVGYAIGRIGCLTSGDGDYGIPTNLPWGMGFPNGIDPTPPGVRVHPTPLYEFVVGLLIAWWLWRRGALSVSGANKGGRHQRPKALGVGAITGEYLVLTGIARFLVEFIRRNPHVVLGLSNAQLASVASVAAGAMLMAWAGKRGTSRLSA